MINYFLTAEAGIQARPPGSDPDALQRAIATLRHIAQGLDDAIIDSRSVAHDEQFWSGTAADAFRTQIDKAPTHLTQVVDRYRDYAAALSDYAHCVGLDRLDFSVAQQALRDADAAARALDHGPAQPGPSPSGPAHHDPSQGTVSSHDVDTAYLHVRQALQRLNRCLDQAADSARVCARRLHHIDNADDLHNPHGWQAAVDNLSSVLGNLATAAGVLSVIAAIVFPPAGAILALAALGMSAAKLGLDAGRKFGYKENVSWVDLGVDALGVIPLGGAGGVARAGVSGARTARVAGQSAGRVLGNGLRGGARVIGKGAVSLAGDAGRGARSIAAGEAGWQLPGISAVAIHALKGSQELGSAVDTWGFDEHGAKGVVTGRWAKAYWSWRWRQEFPQQRMVTPPPPTPPARQAPPWWPPGLRGAYTSPAPHWEAPARITFHAPVLGAAR